MKDIEKNNEAFKALSLVSRRIAELESESELIKTENAKLRKLAKRMYAAFQRVFPDVYRLDFEQDMRELGVEVPDAWDA